MIEFWISQNRLSGSIPASFSALPNLQYFIIKENKFTGHIDHLFNSSAQVNLDIVDLSSNFLEGSLPAELFALPKLQTLVLSKNCFSGELPMTLCNLSSTVTDLFMDGLSTGAGCPTYRFLGSNFPRYMSGDIPSCLWDNIHLQKLHLAANGLGYSRFYYFRQLRVIQH